MVKHYSPQKLFLISLLISLPFTVLAECTCELEDEHNNRSEAMKYKLGAIASILVASFIGVCLPIVGKRIPSLSPETNLFFIVKAFAAGVILATGFMHVLPNAFVDLSSPCLNENPWGQFPFAGFVAMMAAIVTLAVDVSAASRYGKTSGTNGSNEASVTNGAPLRTHGDSLLTKLRYRVISQVLGLGITIPSRMIGIALGACDSPEILKPLVAALTFYQFFEGMALGGCITQAKFKTRAIIIMNLFFSLTTPVGIAIGIGVTKFYRETDPKALIVQGIFNSASAGILIYVALVGLLSADFMNPKMQSNGKLLFGANISLLLGAGFMSLLVHWA